MLDYGMTDKSQQRAVLDTVALDEIRAKRDMSLGDLSRLSGVNRSALTRLRNGSRSPRSETLLRLATVLECQVDEIVRLESKTSKPQPNPSYRALAFMHYGSVCECCGEDRVSTLRLERSKPGPVPDVDLFRWLVVRNFPKGWVPRCYNCSVSGSLLATGCPHRHPLLGFVSAYAREVWRARIAAVQAYGSTCGVCGLKDSRFLTLTAPGSLKFLRALAADGFPPNPAFGVICQNCRFGHDE